MNAMIRKISGTFDVVNLVPDDKLDELAALLGLSEEETAHLKRQGSGLAVVVPSNSDDATGQS